MHRDLDNTKHIHIWRVCTFDAPDFKLTEYGFLKIYMYIYFTIKFKNIVNGNVRKLKVSYASDYDYWISVLYITPIT